MKFITIQNNEPGVVNKAKMLKQVSNASDESENFDLKGSNSNQRHLKRSHRKFNSILIDSISKSKGIDKD